MNLMQYTRPGTWASFGRLSNLQDELNNLFDPATASWAPALDVHEDKDAYTIRVELPGMKREEIGVTVEDDTLSISGERKSEAKKEETSVHRQERAYGKFSRVLTFPTSVASDKVTAAYKDGILTVTVPKAEQAKPKSITVSE